MTDPRFAFVDGVSSASTAELRDRLGGTVVFIEVTPHALATFPGQVLAYQLATLAVRLFDRIELAGDETAPAHRHLSLLSGAFLPALRDVLPTLRPLTPEPESGRAVRVVIGEPARDGATADLFVGAVDWVALLSTSSPRPVREGVNPCGALAAGALAAAEVFKLVFDGRLKGALRGADINLSLLSYAPLQEEALMHQPPLPERASMNAVLVGCGSVGCAFLEGVLLTPMLAGRLTTVDNGVFDLRNPYKYALLNWAAAQEGASKAEWARDQVVVRTGSRLEVQGFVGTANEYVASLPEDYRIPIAVSAVDTMEARLEIQDMLPCAVVNAGIRGTLVEISSHDFGRGPCVGCLTMRQTMESWNAEPIATAIGLRPERVRELIEGNGPMTRQDVNEIIGAGKIRMDLVLELESYVGQPLLSFVNRMPYAETSVATPEGGAPARVTTAFVSAFAGALLFAEFLKVSIPALAQHRVNNSYRQDLLGVPADGLFLYERDPEGWCACYSPFRLRVYEEKYGSTHAV